MALLRRLCLIAIAALLVVGAALAWNQISSSASQTAGSQPPGRVLSAEARTLESAAGDRPEGGHEAGGRAAAGEVAKNVLIVGALTLAVAGGSRLWEWARKGGRRAPPQAA